MEQLRVRSHKGCAGARSVRLPAVLAAVLLTGSFVLSGCGGAETPTPTAGAPTAAAPAAQQTPSPIAAGVGAEGAGADSTGADSTGTPAVVAANSAAPAPVNAGSQAMTTSDTLSATATITATLTPCAAPAGWAAYEVQPGETLTQLAGETGSTVEELLAANCLQNDQILAGQMLLLPAAPLRTPTPCAAPAGWQGYTVQAGDTLSLLAALAGSSATELQTGNCKENDILIAGETLYLPRAITHPARQPPAPPLVPLAPAGQPDVQPGPPVVAPPQAPGTAGGAADGAAGGGAAGGAAGGGAAGGATGESGPAQPVPSSPFDRMTGLSGPPVSFPDPSGTVREQCAAAAGNGFRVATDNSDTELEIGQTHYFYACDLAGNRVKAWFQAVNGGSQQELPVYWRPPIPDVAAVNPYPVAVWAALPGTPTGDYEIVMEDAQGHTTAPLQFSLKAPTIPWILAVPVAGRRGTRFEIYYINFAAGPLTSGLRRTATAGQCYGTGTQQLEDLQVTIDQTAGTIAWGSLPLTAGRRAGPACYILSAGQAEDTIIMLN